MAKTIVYSMEDDREFHYSTISPIDALISTAMIEDGNAHLLTEKAVREQYKGQIVEGDITFGINDFYIRKEGVVI